MDLQYLDTILRNCSNVNWTQEITAMYATEKLISINIDRAMFENSFQKAIVFTPSDFDLEYTKGTLKATGLCFYFKHKRFRDCSINVMYDSYKKQIFNYALFIPEYTREEFIIHNNNIRQQANTIRRPADLKAYINRLYRRFECPKVGV